MLFFVILIIYKINQTNWNHWEMQLLLLYEQSIAVIQVEVSLTVGLLKLIQDSLHNESKFKMGVSL